MQSLKGDREFGGSDGSQKRRQHCERVHVLHCPPIRSVFVWYKRLEPARVPPVEQLVLARRGRVLLFPHELLHEGL